MISEKIDKLLLKYFTNMDFTKAQKDMITIFLKDKNSTKIELDKRLNTIKELAVILERNYIDYYYDEFRDNDYTIAKINNIIKEDINSNEKKIRIIQNLYDIIRIMEEGMYENGYFDSDRDLEDILKKVLDESIVIEYIFHQVNNIQIKLKDDLATEEAILESLKEISEAEKDKAARTIQKFTQIRLDKKKSAAEKIQKIVKEKLDIITNNIPLGELLCNQLTKKEVYRSKILEMTGNTGILEKLSLYYCKLGSKVLGRDDNSKNPNEKYSIREFKNCTFLNLSLKSTNLIEIIFNSCKFLGGYESADLITKFLSKNPKYRNIHKDTSNREIIFESSKLEDTTFNKCEFINRFKLDDINVANTRFSNCKFTSTSHEPNIIYFNKFNKSKSKKSNTEIVELELYDLDSSLESMNGKEKILLDKKVQADLLISESTFTNIEMRFYNTKSLVNHTRASMKSTILPCILFNKINFINTKFTELLCCIEFKDSSFENCNFENVTMTYISFKNCIFNNCKFITSKLSHDKGVTIFKDCEFKNSQFLKCLFNDYTIEDLFLANTLRFISCNFTMTTFFACVLVNFLFNYYGDERNMLNLNKCRFVTNCLYGTNFDYCNLEGTSFAATVADTEKINSFGSAMIVLDKTHSSVSLWHDYLLKDPDEHYKDITKYLDEKKNILYSRQLTSIIVLENIDFNEMNINRFNYMNSTYIKDKLEKKFERFLFEGEKNWYWIIPATSFKGANIRSCNFQQLEGFEDFDFTQVKKTSDGKPDLNATNFTGCDLTNANLEGANLIGTIFQVANITRTNFKDTVVNDNTDFENANFEEAINTEHINIEGLQRGANETHARAQTIIDNYDKLNIFLLDPINTNDNGIPESMIKSLMTTKFIPNSKTGTNFTKEDREFLKKFFTAVIPNAICSKLKSKLNDPDGFCKKVLDNFTVCIEDEFINLIISKHVSGTGTWSWLEITYSSILFLLSQTELYVYTFIQFYFNEVFNAHGEGSKSCPKGMVERLIAIHSQTAEFYNITIGDLDPSNSELISSVANYDTNRVDNKDPVITEEYVSKFSEKEKYKFNKLINLTKPDSVLPENEEQDLGFTISKDISPENRKRAHILLGKVCKSPEILDKYGEVDNLNKLCIIYAIVLHKIILENHTYNGVQIDVKNIPKELERNPIFKRMVANMDEYIFKKEIPAFRTSVIYLYGTEESDIKKDEVEDYLLPQEGGIRPLNSKAKSKSKTISKPRSILKSSSKSSSKSKTRKTTFLIDNEKEFSSINDKITPELVYSKFVNNEKKMINYYLKLEWSKILSKLKINRIPLLESADIKATSKSAGKIHTIKKKKLVKKSKLNGTVKASKSKSKEKEKLNINSDIKTMEGSSLLFYDLISEINLSKKINPVTNIMYDIYNKQITKNYSSIKIFNKFNNYIPKESDINKIMKLNKIK